MTSLPYRVEQTEFGSKNLGPFTITSTKKVVVVLQKRAHGYIVNLNQKKNEILNTYFANVRHDDDGKMPMSRVDVHTFVSDISFTPASAFKKRSTIKSNPLVGGPDNIKKIIYKELAY